MILFLQAIFVSVVILHRNNIWVALIPNPSALLIDIGMYILLFSIVVRRLYLVKYPYRMVVFSCFCLLAILASQFFLDREVRQIAAYFLLSSISVLIISLWKTRQEINAIKVYIILCSIISILGIIAWLIVNYTFIFDNYIDHSHLINLSEFTAGRMGRGGSNNWTNVFGLSLGTYSFPYSLGLVLTGSYAYDFLGVPFFRASGIFHEPVSNSFMIISVFILVFNSTYFSKWQRRTLLIIQFCYLIVTFSLSIIISLLSVYILYNVFVLLTKKSLRENKSRILRLVVTATAIGFSGYYTYKMIPAAAFAKNILSSKFSVAYFDIVLRIMFSAETTFIYVFSLVLSLVCLWRAVKTNNKTLMSYSLIMVSLLIVSLKGVLFHFLINPAFSIFYFFMLKHLGKSVLHLRSRQLMISEREIP